MPRESARWATIGWSAPSIRHSIWRDSATLTGAVWSAISAASAVGRRQQLVGRVHAAHQPAGERLGRWEDPAREHPLGRLLDADQPGQEPRRAGLRHDAPPGEHEPEPGLLGRQPDVHRQRHGDADADRRPVDGARSPAWWIGRSAATPCPPPSRGTPASVIDVAPAPAERLGPGGEVSAGAEASTAARHDDGPHVVVGVGSIEGVEQLVHHPVGERVEPLRSVEGDGGHAVRHVVIDLGVVHGSAR